MPVHSFTEEKILLLENEYKSKQNDYSEIQNKTIKTIWKEDLSKF